jgi:polyisoprenoid-binding protein YceI
MMVRKLLPALLIIFVLAVAGCAAPSSAGTTPGNAAVNPTTAAVVSTTAPTTDPTATTSPDATTAMTPTVAANTAVTGTTDAVTTGTVTTTNTMTSTGAATTTAPASTGVVSATAAVSPTAAAGTASTGPIRLTFAPDTTANYKVREQLARRNLPNDAIGTTSGVTGQIVIMPDGTLPAGQSQITVDLTTLTTDSRQRDRYVQRNTLDTAQYPTATFVPTSVQGLPTPLPAAGNVTLKLIGNLTIHGVTKPATWDARATIANNAMKGTATTAFTFEDYGMSPPQAMIVLSVQDHVELDVNFDLVKTQ